MINGHQLRNIIRVVRNQHYDDLIVRYVPSQLQLADISVFRDFEVQSICGTWASSTQIEGV